MLIFLAINFVFIQCGDICHQKKLKDCLHFEKYQISLILQQNSKGYSYSFWSMYISADRDYESDIIYRMNGELMIQETQTQNQDLRALLILDWTGFQNTEKQLHFDLINDKIFNAATFTFESMSYEGKWMFYNILYEFPNKIQIIIYDVKIDDLKITQYIADYDLSIDVLQIQIMGDLQNNNIASDLYLTSFFGQISDLDIEVEILISINNYQEFINYFQQYTIPQPYCDNQKFENYKISNFIYEYGLIQFESWIQVDYVSTLNLSMSIFGVDFLLKPNFNMFQKLLDLQYCFIQAWTSDLANGVYFQILNKTQPDFLENLEQNFLGNLMTFKTLYQNLKLWHFVSVFYGVDQFGQPHQQLKMWFLNGDQYEVITNNPIYSLFGLNLTIRSPSKFIENADGLTIKSSQNKITVCIPEIYELIKMCHYSCKDCDGPDQFSCLSCRVEDQRFLENRQCKCNFGSIENLYGNCVDFKTLYTDAIFQFNPKDQGIYKHGYFLVPYQNTILIFPCPQYYGNEQQILCVECKTDPENFYKSMICKTDYIINNKGQYELKEREASEISLYYFETKTFTIEQCIGCQSYCDQNQEQDCHYHIKLQKNIKCQAKSYFYEGQCNTCHFSCSTCENNHSCHSCDQSKQLYLDQKTKLCLKCSEHCLECANFDQCLKCEEEFYTLYNGICYQCGQNCRQCMFMLDKQTGLYYNRCINCIDNQYYFLTLNATFCIQNLDPSCLFKIQIHKSWFVRMTDNTIFHLFQPKNLDDSQIINYCALCYDGFISTMNDNCVKIQQIYPDDKTCVQMYQIENFRQASYGQLIYQCQVYSQVQEVNQHYSISNGCQYFIRNCIYCYQDMCLMCFPGYYADLFSGQCQPCPEELNCYKCVQTSKVWNNGWKIWYRIMYSLIKFDSFFNDIFGQDSSETYQIICQSCQVQYEYFQNFCIKKCPENCQQCEIRNGKNYCIKCQLYENRPLSLYNGECFDCPRNCLLCKPKTLAQLYAVNPYFNNQDVISSTHTCLKLNEDLSENDYYYDSTFKQFFKIKSQSELNDPTFVSLNFNLYCDEIKFENDLNKAINQQQFLIKNIKLNELITDDILKSNFGRIENLNLFQYLSNQQISDVEFKFQMLQSCQIDQHSFIFTTLTKNIFFLNSARITINGNNNTLILFDHLEILGFNRITLENIKILPYYNDHKIYLHLQSSNFLICKLQNIQIYPNNINNLQFNINFTNIQELLINQLSIIDSQITDQASLFELKQSNAITNMLISIINFQLVNSLINNSCIILFRNELQSKIILVIQGLQIIDSNLTQSNFYSTIDQSQINLEVEISDLNFQNSQFIANQPIFLTYFLKQLKITDININQSNFTNTIIIQASLQLLLSNLSIMESNIINSFIIKSYNTNFQNVSLQNIQIKKINYELQQSFIELISTQTDSVLTIDQIQIMNAQIINSTNSYFIASSTTLIYLQAQYIELKNTKILRTQGLTEFMISSSIKVNIISVDIQFNNVQKIKPILTDSYCQQEIDTTKYTKLIIIEKSQQILIKQFTIDNLIIYDAPLIQIQSLSSQTQRRSELITIDELFILNCVIVKTQTIKSISLFEVRSEQQISIIFNNCLFQNNIYFTYIKEIESDSALIFNIIAIYSIMKIQSSQFLQNIILQSENSLINIYADDLIMEQSIFTQNNIFTKQFTSKINWNFIQNKISYENIQNYIPCLSQSGNGNLQVSKLTLNSITMNSSFSIHTGCFKINLQNQGDIQILDSSFQDITTQFSDSSQFGGCLQIIDQSSSFYFLAQNSNFSNIYGLAEGGVFYSNPISQNTTIIFQNIQVTDCYSLNGNFIKINFINEFQKLNIINSRFFQSMEGFIKFQEFARSTKILQSSLIQIDKGSVMLENILLQLFITSMIDIINQSQVSLQQIYIENSYYKNNPFISITLSQDSQSSVQLFDIQIKNCQSFTQNQNFYSQDISQLIEQSYNSEIICQQNNDLTIIQSIYESISLQDYLIIENSYPINNFIQILQIKQNDQITLKKLQLANNICDNCLNGLIYIEFIQSQVNISQIFNLQIIENECGYNGCLFIRFLNNNQQNKSSLNIIDFMCIKNKAIKGVCITSYDFGLNLQNSLLTENYAQTQGGAIYYNGSSTNLVLINNLIISNTAYQGGAIYIENNSIPDLTKTLNYLNNNSALDYGNISSNRPIQLSVKFNNQILQNYHQKKESIIYSYIFNQVLNNENIFILPSGQQINQYKFFNITNQQYQPLNLGFRIVALNSYYEQQKNLNDSYCDIFSGILNNNNETVFNNNYTNMNIVKYDQVTGDYNLDSLILFFGNDNNKLILQFQCSSIMVPIFNYIYPYKIISFQNKYILQLTIRTYPCQLGEYKNLTDNACYLCDVNKKQYSVVQNAQICNFMNEETTETITPAQLKLKPGYWRPFINSEIIEKCDNNLNNCLGGWIQGDQSCEIGQLGACCESCDNFNIRGDGQYTLKQLYKCSICENQTQQIIFIILVSIWNLISIYLTSKGVETMLLELLKNKVGNRQLIINNNKQTGPIMKMFVYYLQIVSIILNFNVEIPQTFKDYYNILGNSQATLLINSDCFLVQQFQIGLLYQQIIFSLISPICFGIIFFTSYFLATTFSFIQFNLVIITTSLLYLFCYFQMLNIQLLISALSYRTKSGIKWVLSNLSYKYYNQNHIQWIPYLITLLIILGFIIPIILFIKLFYNRYKLQKNNTRKQIGYLYLEYQPKAYYWEIVRILSKELIIISISFYQDQLILKGSILLIIIFFQTILTNLVQPFKTKMLNKLDHASTLLCTFTLIVVLSLSKSQQSYSLLIFFIFIPNIILFILFTQTLISGYLQAYEVMIDKFRDILRNRYKSIINNYPFLKKLLENRQNRRKIVMQRFQLIKIQLFLISNTQSKQSEKSKNILISTNRTSSGIISPRNYNILLFKPQQILSTNNEDQILQQQAEQKE